MSNSSSGSVYVPGSIGNVGPGFDVLGLAVEGIGDRVMVTLRPDHEWHISVSGVDAAQIPLEPEKNTAAIAARAMMLRFGHDSGADVRIVKGLRLSSGMGGSAASSVGGAAAMMLALRGVIEADAVISAALEGEAFASGRHLDNILPSTLGGFTLARSVEPLDYVSLRVKEQWWVALVTPAVRIETKTARSILDREVDRTVWIQQMANTASMVHAFAEGDAELLLRAVSDVYAEPRRKSLIPRFDLVKDAAIRAGAIGCSISGSGPTMFAIAPDESTARHCAEEMRRAFGEIESSSHAGAIARQGVRVE